ncbi:N-acetylmuramoyl-L-alanine amidase [Algivirga pacifica]|uniref:N-acetylmuramoyl-L-alanine amidase n=1 Tax=Algivirga pacifica TaxID=1162670 RepID=A0ABP9DNK7_9BACT
MSVSQGQQAKKIKKTRTTPFVVVIDPGHGGKDTGQERGAKGRMHEKDLNLVISKYIGVYLQKNINDVKVLYTREDDSTVSLDERVDFANQQDADLFLSVHCNSLPMDHYKGTEIHIQIKEGDSFKLAKLLNSELKDRARRPNRGIRSVQERGYNLQVLKYTQMPAVLVECGFMTNQQEEKYLNSKFGQEIVASAIYRATKEFILSTPSVEKTKTESVYKVQLASSKEKLDLNTEPYVHIKDKIELYYDENNGPYKYRYLIGTATEMTVARTILKKAKESGFPKASIVAMNQKDRNTELSPDYTHKHWAIQVMAGANRISLHDKAFKALQSEVEVMEKEGLYKYIVGRSYKKEEVVKLLKKVKKQEGFKKAFLVEVDAEDIVAVE